MRESGEPETLEEMHRNMMVAVQERIAREADEAGLSLDAYEERLRQEERDRAELDREQAEREHRARQLAKVRPHLTEGAYRALIYDKKPLGTEAMHAVRDWCMSRGEAPPILVLTGAPGCGKTLAAASAMAHCTRRVEYVRASHLAARYEPFSGDREREIEPLDMTASLLVLDDVGTERRSADGRRDPRFMPALSDVVDSRMQLDTIITTNLSKSEFIQQYCDGRLASRMEQLAHFHGCGKRDLRRAGR